MSSSAQDLNGKWFLTKEGNTYIVPENLILDIDKDSIKYYSFDHLHATHSLKVEDNKIKIGDGEDKYFEFINKNRIRFKSQKEEDSINLEYVRLVPTRTSLKREEIENLSFDFIWKGDKINIQFNQELKPDLRRMTQRKEFTKILLEKIDLTYFASVYQFGERTDVIPIKEINLDKMILYGTPGEPYEIVSEKIQ